jgi:hypothetical protein
MADRASARFQADPTRSTLRSEAPTCVIAQETSEGQQGPLLSEMPRPSPVLRRSPLQLGDTSRKLVPGAEGL